MTSGSFIEAFCLSCRADLVTVYWMRGTITGVQIIEYLRTCPSPFGRRWPGGPDEGGHAEMLRHSRPHPAFGHPLPEGEGHTPIHAGQSETQTTQFTPLLAVFYFARSNAGLPAGGCSSTAIA